jgi:cell division protein FtsB
MMRSHYWIALAVVTTSLVFGYSVFSHTALPHLWRMNLKAEALRSRMVSLYDDIAVISGEIELLADSSPKGRAYLKRVAREELGMIGPGEILLTLDEDRIQKGLADSHEKNIHP